MILGILFGFAILTVPLFRGSLARIGEIRLTHIGSVAGALVLQVLIVSVLPGTIPVAASAAIHLMSYGLTLIFVWHNRTVPGMAILVAGGLMNLAAIAANGGVMPASAEALARSGKADLATDAEFNNSTVQADARLQILGDIFAIPDGYPFANVFSIGDILLVAGGAVTVHTVGGSAIARRGRIDMRRRISAHAPESSEAYKLTLLNHRVKPSRPPKTVPPVPDAERRRRERVRQQRAQRSQESQAAGDP